MWPTGEKMQEFQALSYRDKLRVRRCLRRGEAPADPRMAAAAVELAESYQGEGQSTTRLERWLSVFLAVSFGILTILAAVEGDQLSLIIYAFTALGWALNFMSNPATWPKNMAKSLEASRRIPSGG